MDRLFTLLEDQLGFPLFENVEATKRGLSAGVEAEFRFDYPGIDIQEQVKRTEFEDYASPSLEAIIESLDETLTRAGLASSRIDRVLCTGGTARVPWIREALASRFGSDKLHDLDPFRGVASGLMKRAQELG